MLVASFLEKVISSFEAYDSTTLESMGEPTMAKILQAYLFYEKLTSSPPANPPAMVLKIWRMDFSLPYLLISLSLLDPRLFKDSHPESWIRLVP